MPLVQDHLLVVGGNVVFQIHEGTEMINGLSCSWRRGFPMWSMGGILLIGEEAKLYVASIICAKGVDKVDRTTNMEANIDLF